MDKLNTREHKNIAKDTYGAISNIMARVDMLLRCHENLGLQNYEGFAYHLTEASVHLELAESIAKGEYNIWKMVVKDQDKEVDRQIKEQQKQIGGILSALVNKI